MRAFRSHIAVVLLLCFVRVLLPESVILALHRHGHTEKEVAHIGRGYKALLSEKHQHCPVDHLFDVPFQASPELTWKAAFFSYSRVTGQAHTSVWDNTQPSAARLRGPPATA